MEFSLAQMLPGLRQPSAAFLAHSLILKIAELYPNSANLTENAQFLPLDNNQNKEVDWLVLYGHGQLIPHVVEGEEVQKHSPWP